MAAKDDARFKHIAKMVAAQLSTPELPVTAAMVDKGSNATWVQEFMGAGAEGVAVVSAIFAGADVEGATRRLRAVVDAALAEREEKGV